MSTAVALNPKPYLIELTGQSVFVKLKWGQEYKGLLLASDSYMNLQLLNAEEWLDDQCKGSLGEILIRCNNVLYVRRAPEEQ